MTSFAVETDGYLVEGEVIEKQEASARYAAAIASAHEPALLEWIDGRSYRARIFPVPASGSRRVVLRYMELVSMHDGRFEYVYLMRPAGSGGPGASGSEAVTIGELSLAVDLGDAGVGMPSRPWPTPSSRTAGAASPCAAAATRRARISSSKGSSRSAAGRCAWRASPRAAIAPTTSWLRYAPDIDWATVKELPTDLAVVVDTSASADESSRQQKTAAAEAILRAMSPQDKFTLIALDTAPTVIYPKEGLADASEKEIAAALERLADHAAGGATDLGALFDAALGRVHGRAAGGDLHRRRARDLGRGLRRQARRAPAPLARRLARASSPWASAPTPTTRSCTSWRARAAGQAFRIDDVEGSTSEVLRLAGAIKTPTITDLSLDLGAGLDEPMLTAAGKISRGEEVVLLARTHHALPRRPR